LGFVARLLNPTYDSSSLQHTLGTEPFGWAVFVAAPMVVLALEKASSIESFAVKTAPTEFTGDSVPWSRQEAERRCCVEGHLAWMPNEERWAKDGPS